MALSHASIYMPAHKPALASSNNTCDACELGW
eukprot:CAMPEP_0184379188 /NCGR_PEP_ID=MMETSP0007-20130409/3640_1 /TAXON_ID=97485 /ORGANISM="Prymnesium parvum, Strain Texoma1" /LENGTH=31 /DNA_ID= /DNA_START= /DNA_END= /DNA_ORIENTATION=